MGALKAWKRVGSRMLYQQAHVVVREDTLELPDGRGGAGELREEAGYRAGRLLQLGGFWPNNAYLDEVINIYVADELVADPLPADQDEHLEARAFPFDEALAMAQDDRISCGLAKLA